MKLHIHETSLAGVVVIDIDCFKDERGFYMETWNKRDFQASGLDLNFVQEGHSRSACGVVRGLHYQDLTAPMGKLVRCTVGEAFDVTVDLRVGSPTFGRWFGIDLTAENRRQIYIPPGFAHGFQALSESVEMQYKQTGFFVPSSEGTIAWNDADLAIPWPSSNPILSARDAKGSSLTEYLRAPAFRIDDPRL